MKIIGLYNSKEQTSSVYADCMQEKEWTIFNVRDSRREKELDDIDAFLIDYTRNESRRADTATICEQLLDIRAHSQAPVFIITKES